MQHLSETFQQLPRQTADVDLKAVEKLDEMEIQLIMLQEMKIEIKNNLNPNKAPGYDLIIEQILI